MIPRIPKSLKAAFSTIAHQHYSSPCGYRPSHRITPAMSQNPPARISPSLCTLCQDFNIQSFAFGSSRTRGYRLADVRSGSKLDPPCEFCALLFDIAKDLEPPMYFTSSVVTNRSHPAEDVEMWVHLTASENYYSADVTSQRHRLRANRLSVEVGDRFGKVRRRSNEEICFAADDSEFT
jgi:hypothetical protein